MSYEETYVYAMTVLDMLEVFDNPQTVDEIKAILKKHELEILTRIEKSIAAFEKNEKNFQAFHVANMLNNLNKYKETMESL